jgi:hypothetical protein
MELNRMTFTQPDGLRTVYYRGGSGRTLVFLHGGGIDAGCYRELLERLAERYDVIAPNLAGHGGSTVPGKGWGWSDYGNLLSKLLDHLGIQGNGIAAAGHSFGGGSNNVGVIFKGQLRDMEHRRDGPDIITKISCGDSDKAFRRATISKSFEEGTPVKDVVEELYKQLEKEGIERGEWKFPDEMKDKKYRRP